MEAIYLYRYNNKTYRIDDIDFEKNPLTKFTTRSGTEISFVEYYKKVSEHSIYAPCRAVGSKFEVGRLMDWGRGGTAEGKGITS